MTILAKGADRVLTEVHQQRGLFGFVVPSVDRVIAYLVGVWVRVVDVLRERLAGWEGVRVS